MKLFLILFFFSSTCFSQQLLLLKRGEVVSHFSEGEKIRLQTKSAQKFSSGTIQGIHLDYILIDSDTIFLSQIKCIDVRKHLNTMLPIASSGIKLIMAGVLFPFIDKLNSNQSESIGSGVLITSSAFIAVGITLQFINNNYFKIGRNKKLATLGAK